MKIVVLPGVGFHDANREPKLIKYLRKKLPNDDIEYFAWQHISEMPKYPFNAGWVYTLMRTWVAEVIMDFETAIRYALDITVPDADIYIGHSAGSIIALAQGDVPVITFGTPAEVLKDIQGVTISALILKRKIFNIVNKSDVLAWPISKIEAQNFIYRSRWWKAFPVRAHEDYWSNKKVHKIIVKKINEWKQEIIVD